MAAGRPKDFDEAFVLNKAIQVFWKKGYEATSTEDLLDAMQMGKGSMYHSFGSKRDLFRLALDKFINDFIASFTRQLAASDDPIQCIKDFFRSIASGSHEDHQKGCFLGNTVSELASIDSHLEKNAIEKLNRIEDVFYKEIKLAQEKGKLKTKEDPKLLARHLINLWNGINITRRMYPHAKELLHVIEFQLKPIH